MYHSLFTLQVGLDAFSSSLNSVMCR